MWIRAMPNNTYRNPTLPEAWAAGAASPQISACQRAGVRIALLVLEGRLAARIHRVAIVLRADELEQFRIP